MANLHITPVPTDDEVAAITAALQVVLLSGGGRAADDPVAPDPAWRFSGRWWEPPVSARGANARPRPWRR
ncbi:MAG: hypothetical protein AAGD35_10485 [Actinomycetota bacterium]